MQKKTFQFLALVLFASVLVISAINPNLSVKAQGQATISMLTSVGGITDPVPGNTNYAGGSVVALTATANSGFVFQYWIIVTSGGSIISTDNPDILTVTSGTTYSVQALFLPINVPEPPLPYYNGSTGQAVVVLLPAVGGTTLPGPGTYAFTDATAFNISATPLSGWTFDHWVIGGYPLSHGAYSFTDTPTDNPYNVNHGYGYTYSYQPVFSRNVIPEFSPVGTAILAVILIAVAVGAGAFAAKRKSVARVSTIKI